jgi:hypothetical protein
MAEICFAEVCVEEICFAEVCPAELCAVEISLVETSYWIVIREVAEVHPVQACLAFSQRGRSTLVPSSKLGLAKVCSTKICLAEVWNDIGMLLSPPIPRLRPFS